MLRIVVLLFAIIVGHHARGEEVKSRAIDFSTVIKGADGPFKECRKMDDVGKCLELAELTLRSMCVTAAALPDKNATLADQASHGRLAMRLLDAKEMDLSAEDISFLKAQIAKLGYNTMAVYQAIRLLDPTTDH